MNNNSSPDRAAAAEDIGSGETSDYGCGKDDVDAVTKGKDHGASHDPDERTVAQQRVSDDTPFGGSGKWVRIPRRV